jgi:hypothetical protein
MQSQHSAGHSRARGVLTSVINGWIMREWHFTIHLCRREGGGTPIRDALHITRKERCKDVEVYLPATNREHKVPRIPPVVVESLKHLASNALYRDLWIQKISGIVAKHEVNQFSHEVQSKAVIISITVMYNCRALIYLRFEQASLPFPRWPSASPRTTLAYRQRIDRMTSSTKGDASMI